MDFSDLNSSLFMIKIPSKIYVNIATYPKNTVNPISPTYFSYFMIQFEAMKHKNAPKTSIHNSM